MKLTKKLLAMALCLILCLSLSVTAFATEPVPTGAPASSGIVKVLKIDDDVTVPTITFSYSFAPGTADPDNNFFATTTTVTKSFTASDMTKETNMRCKSLSINEIFGADGATASTAVTEAQLNAIGIDHAGVWVYNVSESVSFTPGEGFTETPADSGIYVKAVDSYTTYTKTLSTVEKSYVLRLYVKNTSGGLVIDYVTVWDGSKKVDPTIKPTTTETGATQSVNASEFSFESTYTEKVNKTKPDDPTYGALTVTKYISDSTREYADLTRTFTIKITLTAAATDTSGATGVDAVLYRAKTPSADASSTPTTVNYGENTFDLSDGDYVVIAELPIGVEYKVEEVGCDTQTSDGYVKNSIENGEGQFKSTDAENGIKSKVINDFKNSTPPTGIEVNNLPFALVVALALTGILVVFFSRRRKAED